MKKEYLEPETEIIRYNDEDVIMTSSHHHCGHGSVTGNDYEDTTGDGECDADENFQCGAESGDYSCTEVEYECDNFDEECNGYECGEFSANCEIVTDGSDT